MKNNILIIGCIISCFILVSLTYQPIMAEDNKIEDNYIKSDSGKVWFLFILAKLTRPATMTETYVSINYKNMIKIEYGKYDSGAIRLHIDLCGGNGAIAMGFSTPKRFIGINNDNLLFGFLLELKEQN